VNRWPELKQSEWADTQATLHRWTQIVGKIRLRQERLVNHWWNVALYVTPRGLTTTGMPYRDGRSFEIRFDFISQELQIDSSGGEQGAFELKAMTVTEFYRRLMEELARLNFFVRIDMRPNEVPDATRFDEDIEHDSYDKAAVERFGACSCRRTVYARSFARISSAKLASCIFSGGVSIWR